jgi:hypothetical protein
MIIRILVSVFIDQVFHFLKQFEISIVGLDVHAFFVIFVYYVGLQEDVIQVTH